MTGLGRGLHLLGLSARGAEPEAEAGCISTSRLLRRLPPRPPPDARADGTGREPGRRSEDGTYPEGTINALVDGRLAYLSERARRFARPEPDAPEEGAAEG